MRVLNLLWKKQKQKAKALKDKLANHSLISELDYGIANTLSY